jgi:hypothetical protein
MTSANAPNAPKMAFFCVVGRFRVRTLQFTAKNEKGRQNEKNGVSALSAVLLQNARARCFALVQG